MNLTEVTYSICDDIIYFLETMNTSIEAFAKKTGISKVTVQKIKHGQGITKYVLEKIYSYIYSNKIRLNKGKVQLDILGV